MSSASLSGLTEEDSWFHGKITREEAEELLLQQGEEGSFLVRESTSAVGDYAISVLSAVGVHHVQVKRHEDDAFFSIDDDQIIHGLDELIKCYQSPTSDNDAILLRNAIGKSPPPPDCRRHGRTNLLHRATKEGSIEIVLEMVRCGHRSLDAKNEEGQTAVHLATIQGLNDILSVLIKAGANVNIKDSASCTSLHYACINNFPETLEILLTEGNANPQVRRNENGWVPMHEAASRGHLQCIRLLHKHYAPLRPRTLNDKLPIHLAIENNHEQCILYFDGAQSRKAKTNRDDWYHGLMERPDALRILQLCQKYNWNNETTPKSYFLVRRHSKTPNTYVLTMLYQESFYNFAIKREGNFFYIDDGPYLDSLEHIVDHYSRWPDGLPNHLQIPVGPTQTFSQPLAPPPASSSGSSSSNVKSVLDVPPPLPKRTPICSSPNTFNRLCNDMANNNRLLPPFSKDNIPHELIELGDILGGGEYGEVFQGKLTMAKEVVNVAVKTLKEEMNEWTKKEFLQEAHVMMELEHEHIVKILGICWTPRIYMVQELLALGSMQDYLADHVDEIIPDRDFRQWAHQIAKGMVYLQNKRFVHRDLAARNILLSSQRVAKISDFGLSRALGMGSDYYTASHGGRWPIKWYAPEACSHGTFSHASDVWSYGITIWEIYTFGETPYTEETTGREVIEMVDGGYRLQKPKHCPDKIYSVMKKCWNKDPDLRPTFTFLENFFADPAAVVCTTSTDSFSAIPLVSMEETTSTNNLSTSIESVHLIDLD